MLRVAHMEAPEFDKNNNKKNNLGTYMVMMDLPCRTRMTLFDFGVVYLIYPGTVSSNNSIFCSFICPSTIF